MNVFKNLSISGKFISVVLVILVLEALIALSSTYFLNRANRNLDTIVDVDAEKIKLAAHTNRTLVEIHRAEKNMLLSDTKEAIERYSHEISTYKSQLENRIIELKKLLDTQDQALLVKFSMNYQEFIRINSKIESLVFHEFVLLPHAELEHSAASPDLQSLEAVTLSQGKGREAYDRASEAVQMLVDRTEAGLDASKVLNDWSFQTALAAVVLLAVFSIAIGLISALLVSRSIANGMNRMMGVADAIARGDLETPIEIGGKDEIGKLSVSISDMQKALKKSRDESEDQNWLKTGTVRLNEVMLGETALASLGNNVITEIATYLDAKVGAFYLTDDRQKEPLLSLMGSYAYTKRKNLSNTFKFGEGLVGQAALEKKQILVSNVPKDHIKVVSGLGESSPRFISVIPFLYENQVTGVVEIGFLDQPSDVQTAYLDQAMSTIAINCETIQAREKLGKALAESQTLAEELETQQEELRTTNEELEEQTQALEESEQKLKTQQEELEVANEELREKNESLEYQKKEIEKTRKVIEEKAEELVISGKYKSEFLANMSHELRTPLNSLLLLSSILGENKEGNLTEDQLESAQVIYQSGNDLLSLINEILDLSKIESGKMELQSEDILIRDIADRISANFQHMMDQKGLRLIININDNVPAILHVDRKRIEQIIKNLVSNAIKFTEKGSVTVDFSRPAKNTDLSRSGLDPKNTIAISVRDTGIGISPADQKIVFEAFQQVEGGTARQYGGTGLGLSISRELSRLLKGELQLISEKGTGSVFTIYLPIESIADESPPFRSTPVGHKTESASRFVKTEHQKALGVEPIADDRDSLSEEKKAILVRGVKINNGV
ncbi:MAG: HAMP domain-containing protein [Proteobacteria bacterium]|nr:HAMP domain-containing protein [Pseudomonadota bacterium]